MAGLFISQEHHEHPKWSNLAWVLSAILVFIIISGIFIFAFSQLQYHFNWSAIYKYKAKFIHGWLMTIIISLFSLVLSLFIGFFFAVGQQSRFLPYRMISKVYIEIIRGTPLLVQILIFFYVIGSAFHLNNRYVAGILILSFFAGAYVSEIIRAGIESIGKTQLETAKSLGFTKRDTYRYIIIPQVLKRIMPPLAGQFVSLVKDSSLLSIISVSEFTLNAQEVNSYTYSTLESYIPLAIGYFILTFPISMLTRYLERKFHYET
ncbi:MAG TPA: amino acid ABC transporter permease [Candidatus Cloacimonadota bacterium]|nr:amino acid ABC transporter permease [Candidatus Cloacimonadota bacterium]HPT72554.1 amino acid ABC transporter permease [Candidatus Cloacimonadota bacterium]